MTVGRWGRPATGTEDAAAFAERAFDAVTGELVVERTGQIWEALRTSAAIGATGHDRVVAIIDGRFDLSAIQAERVHPASTARSTPIGLRGHGTIVARLVAAAAPDATLLLLDAFVGGSPREDRVADAVRAAAAAGACVLNISAEFTSDARLRDTSWLNGAADIALDIERAGLLDLLDRWASNGEPYRDARCRRRCAICDALAELDPAVLVVAASGNVNERSCPACFSSSVAVGLERSRRVEVGGAVYRVPELPATRVASLVNAELVVDELPGFAGTSFAAPLVAGLAATVPHPADIAVMARLPYILSPILQLSALLATAASDGIPPSAVQALHAAEIEFADVVPAAHRHWTQESVTSPCAVCSLLVSDWYDSYIAFHLAVSDVTQALAFARVASVLAPFSPSVAGNTALAWEASADRSPIADRRAALLEAQERFARACALAADVGVYRTGLGRVREKLATL